MKSRNTDRYVNVGAINPDTGDRIMTKTALKMAVASGQIAFDQTSAIHDGGLPGIIEPADLKPGIELSVVGPDPYNTRNWYAGVHVGRDGKLKVT